MAEPFAIRLVAIRITGASRRGGGALARVGEAAPTRPVYTGDDTSRCPKLKDCLKIILAFSPGLAPPDCTSLSVENPSALGPP